ncbi:MAG: helix-turn-helix domain-containing protein [Sulfuricaulis sp.]
MTYINQNERIMRELKFGTVLTTYQAFTMLRIVSLPKRISELRRSGHKIKLGWKTISKRCRVRTYSL